MIVTLLRPEQRATHARIRTSACRGYVVDLDPESDEGPRPLRDLAGHVVHFRSLERAQEALRRRGVEYARLYQHHACEELGALDARDTWNAVERGTVVLATASA